MITQRMHGARVLKRPTLMVVIAAGLAVLVALAAPAPADAHCDSRNGPVVTAARTALETGNVNVALPYVQPEAEAELTAVFKQTLAVRKLGGQARDVADEYFLETTVRLHRTGEGAPYTGLTDEPTEPAIAAADQALASGSLKQLNAMLSRAIGDGLAEQYRAVAEARQHAATEKTVAAERERVEAELAFEKYVFALSQAAEGSATHAEGGAAPHADGR
ncbi:MAG: hypothetical protein RLZZ387_5494 [Chloroflexota bacterium]